MSGPPPLTRPFSLPGNPPPPSPKSNVVVNSFPPPPSTPAPANVVNANNQRADPLHPSHAFLAAMLPLSDQLLANMSGVESNHPLAEVLYETCMTLRETLNLYAASSPSLLAAAAAASPAPPTPVAATALVPIPATGVATSSQPQPKLHEVGLESLFTRTQKMQSVFQQRMWADRTAMTHRTNIDVAMGTTQSCSAALLSPNSSTMLSTNIAWQSFVVYKKGHELLALDNAALSSLNLNSNSHLTCSFANASNLTPILPPSFQSPFKLLLDLRWVTGVREINSANSSSSKEYGCELLVKFVDALPMGHSHGLAVSTVGSGATPQASPERFVHLRFGGDSERQKIAQVLKAAAHRNTWSESIAKQPIPDRVTLYQQLGLFPSITNSDQTSNFPFAALSPLDGAFLFSPRFSSPDLAPAASTSSSFSLQYLPPAVPPPVTPVQAMLQAVPFVNSFPVIWPSREATLLAKHKPRVLEIVIFPHQILPLNLGMITSTSPNANNWGARSNILRIWKSGSGLGASGKDKSDKDSSSNSGEKSDKNSQGGDKDGKDDHAKDGRLFERTTLTGCYADFEEKESSVSLTPSELVDIRVNYDTLELELTCYITKGSNRDEGAYNGRNTRSSSLAVPPTPGALTSSNSVSSAAAAAAAALSSSANIDLHPNSKYTTRKFLFSSGLLLRRFLDLLRWWQSSHRDVGASPEKSFRIHDVELRLREMEMKNFVSTNFGRGSVSLPSLLPAAGSVATSASTSQAPLPVCTLSSLFSAMYQAHPYSKHCFDLFTLTRDLPQTKEGTLERLQLLVRKLYACGVTASSMAAASLNLTPPPASPVAERTNGLGGMGDMRSIVCTCSGTSARPLPVPAAPSRAPPPFPGAASNVSAGTGASASNMPLPPTRPPPATNSCYLLFYQIFLKCNGLQDLLFLLTDVTAATSAAAIKRWALRGVWCLFEYVKPLVSASVMPLTTMGATTTATSPTGGSTVHPASGSLKGGHVSAPSISDASQFGASSLATAAGVTGQLTHFQLTSLSAVRCRTKLLTIWDEESINTLNQLFKSNFSAFITSLVSPISRIPSNLDSAPQSTATANPAATTTNSTPSSSPFLPLSFHDSLIDVLFEIVVNNVRLDTVYSSTTTTEPITTYYNAPATNSSPPSTVSTLRAPAAFSSNVKREPRVQVLNKPLVNLQILALILHLLPHGPLASTVLTLENFTWLLNGNVGNVRELLWNLEVGNGNFGGNLYFLLSLATQWMEGANAETAAMAAAAPAAGATGPSKKNYSTFNMMNSPVQKGSWDIFLDTAAPDSSWIAPGDHALAFNLTVTLFTTLHYHSMREYLNSSVMFLSSGGSTAEEKLLTASSAGGPTSPTNETDSPNPTGALPNSPLSPGASTLSPSYGGASQGEKEKDVRSLPPPNDSPERVRFRSSLLFRTIESLKHLNGWNESTTSVIRVMIICLLNVLRSESRSFTGNFDLTNNSGNNYAYNQFLVLLYVIEEFIFFRPLAAAVTSPQSALNTGIVADSNSSSVDDGEEGGAGSSFLGLNFDFGDDFEWNESTMSTNAESLLPGSTASGVPISNCKTLGRALDVPVIDKVLDSFLSLKLATAQTAKLILGSNEKEHNNTSTVLGDGSSDKYEKKMLDLFGREFRTWTEYRTILSNISKATLAGNYKAQVDESAALVALVRSHQADRLKNLNSLANYSKKSSGFFGGGSFGGGSSSGSKAAQLRAAYGIKDGNGQGVTLHAHLFGLINKVVAKSREHQNAEGANAKRASGSIMQTGATSLLASPNNGSASLPGTPGISPALKDFALHQPRGPRSRASLLLNSHRITATLPDSKSEAEKLQALIRAKRSFNSIRHAKDFCEKERRRSSLFAQQGGSLIGSMITPAAPGAKDKTQTISSGLAAALTAAKQADSATTSSNGPTTPSKVVPIPPATPNNLAKTAPPVRSPLSAATSSTADSSPPSATSTLGSPQPPSGVPTRLPPPPPPIPSSVPTSGIAPPPIPASYRGASHGSSGSNNSSNSSSALAQAAAIGEEDYGEGDDKIGDLSPSLSSPMSTERSLSLGAFVCTVCNAPLPASAFWERAGLAYCARDFVRTFLSCMVCKERIIYSEGVEETAAEKEERHKREAVEGAMAGRQYLTLSEDRIVHNKCLKCDTCHLPLAPSPASSAANGSSSTSSPPSQSVNLFQHSGKYYCQNDYYNMFGHKCAHCKQVITTSQSIQLSADDEEAENNHSDGTESSASTFYHIECFVCSVCSADLRKLEADQEEADERAFERGEAIDPASRAPVFQSDGAGKVYCWKDWTAKQQGGVVPPPLPTATVGSGSPTIGASPPPVRKISNASPKGPTGVVPPPSRSGSTTLTPNPLLATRAPSRSFAVQNDSGVTPAPAPATTGGFGLLHSTSSGFGKALTTAGAPGSAPNSYMSGLSPLRTAERSGSGADSMFRVDSSESMTSIGEDLDESELSKSYSRSRS